MFSALVLSMIIPFAGINMVNATQNGNTFNIGKVEDGTYNETASLQRAKQIIHTHLELISQKDSLEKQMMTKSQNHNLSDIEKKTITYKVNALQVQISNLANEFDQIQQENRKLYYVDPVLYQKYVSAKDTFVNDITQKYKIGSSVDDAKNTFPLVAASINHKKKAVEIVLTKDTANSPNKDQYIGIIASLMPKDIPWFVSYDNPYLPVSCTDKNSACTPIMGGINIGVKNKFACALGFEATRSGVTGFVTVGHCAAGQPSGTPVYQPFPSGPTVGSLVTELWSGRTTVTCDCAFISTGSTSISDQIFFSSTYQPKLISSTSSSSQAGSIVAAELASGQQTGTVTNTNLSATYGSNPVVTNLVQASLPSICGDSGSPVTNSLFSPSLYGIVSLSNAPRNPDGSCTGTEGTVTEYVPPDVISSQLGATPVFN